MKTCMKQLLLLAMIFVTITATGSNVNKQELNTTATPEYKTAVKDFLDVVGFGNTMKENLTATYAQFGLEGQYIDDLVNELADKLPEKMADVYSRYFTLDEIKQLAEVNKNEVQVKIRSLQPQINKELIQEGQCYASGKPSPSAGIVVPADFDNAMREYFEMSGFEKQMEQLQSLFESNFGIQKGALGGLYNEMPDMMVRIYSQYFTTSEIQQAAALSAIPCMKKFIEMTPAISQDTIAVTQEIIMEYFKNMF